MTKTKKIGSLIFAILFATLTFGAGIFLPSIFKNLSTQSSSQSSVSAEADFKKPISTSGLTATSIKGYTFYQISSASELAGVAYAVNEGVQDWASANYILTADIDLKGAGWTPIGTAANPFTGRFNGNGHTISGMFSVEGVSYDEYVGLFGYVGKTGSTKAAIYDLVIGSLSFTPSVNDVKNAGRLAGHIENAVLADIYDWGFVTIPTSLKFMTIGTIGSDVTLFGGDSFVMNGVLKTPGTYTDLGLGIQFGYSSISSFSLSGSSLYVVDDEIGQYQLGDEVLNGGIRILHSGRAVINAEEQGIISNNYISDLPKVIGEDETIAENDVVLVPSSTGKKPTGFYTTSTTGGSKISTVTNYLTSYPSKNGPLYARWKDLTYNATVNLGYGDNQSVNIQIPFYESWDAVIDQLTEPGEGYILSAIIGADTQQYAGEEYYSTNITWNDDFTIPTINESYPKGDKVVHWSDTNVSLQAQWQQTRVNSVFKLDNNNDDKVTFTGDDVAVISINAVYKTSSGSTSVGVALSGRGEQEPGVYDLVSAAGTGIEFIIKLKSGFSVANADILGGGSNYDETIKPTITYLLKDKTENTYSVIIGGSGIISSDAEITVTVQRAEMSIGVKELNSTGVSSFDIVEEDENYTSFNAVSKTVTTRIGESFTLRINWKPGYEYNSYNLPDGLTFVGISHASDSAGLYTEISVSVTGVVAENQFINVEAKAMNFYITAEVDYEEYLSELPGYINVTNGEEGGKTQTGKTWTLTLPDDKKTILITTENNDYYIVDKIEIRSPNSKTPELMSKVAETGDDGVTQWKYVVDNVIGGGETYTIKVYWKHATYSVNFKGMYRENNLFTDIRGVYGQIIADTDSVITFKLSNDQSEQIFSYEPGQNIVLSYNIISEYYKFVDWYYSNGDAVFEESGSKQLVAPASNLNIYGVVKGKTATVTLNSPISYYEYNDKIYSKSDLGRVTSVGGTPSVEFVFSNTSSGEFTIQTKPGYTVSKILIGPSSATITKSGDNYEANGYYEFSDISKLNYSGLLNGSDFVNENIYDLFNGSESGWQILVLVKPLSASVLFNAGDGEGAFDDLIYSYAEKLDLTKAMANFSKVGYNATGWEVTYRYTVAGNPNETTVSFEVQDQTLIDNLIDFSTLSYNTNLLNLLNNNGQITLKRLYNTPKEFVIKLDANNGQIEGETSVAVEYDTEIGELPVPTRTGYTFTGWKINESPITSQTVWNDENIPGASQSAGENALTAVAQWQANQYYVRIYFNGGVRVSGTDLGDMTVENSIATEIDDEKGFITISMPYDTSFDIIKTEMQQLSRQSFVFDNLAWIDINSSGNDTTYSLRKLLSSGDVLSIEDLVYFDGQQDIQYDLKENSQSTPLNIFVKWNFASDAVSAELTNTSVFEKTYNASDQLLSFNNDLAITYLFNDSSAGIEITEFSVQYSDSQSGTLSAPSANVLFTQEGLTVKNVADSGYYAFSLTFVDSVSIDCLANTIVVPVTSGAEQVRKQVVINPAYLLSYNGTADFNLQVAYNTVKEIAQYNKDIFELIATIEADSYDEMEIFDALVASSDFADFENSISNITDDQGKTFFSKMLVTTLIFNDTVKTAYQDVYAEVVDNAPIDLGLPGTTEFNAFVGADADELIDLIATNLTYTAQSSNAYVNAILLVGAGSFAYYDTFADGNFWYDDISIANGFTVDARIEDVITILPSLDGVTENSDVGNHYIAIQIAQEDAGALYIEKNGNKIFNYSRLQENAGKFYIVLSHENLQEDTISTSSNWNGLITAPILYSPSITFNMTANKGVDSGEIYKFEIVADNVAGEDKLGNVFTSATAEVETTASNIGTYSFTDGTLIIKSYVLNFAGGSYTITRGDNGIYTVTATSGAGVSNSTINLSNISLYVDGNFEIIANSAVNEYTFEPAMLSAGDGGSSSLSREIITGGSGVDLNQNYGITISSVTFNLGSDNITVNASEIDENGTYTYNGNFIFQLKNNGTAPILYATQYVVGLQLLVKDATDNVNERFVGALIYENGSQNYEGALKGLSSFASAVNGSFTVELKNLDNSNLQQAGQEDSGKELTYNAYFTKAGFISFSSISDNGTTLSSGFVNTGIFANFGDEIKFADYYGAVAVGTLYSFDGIDFNGDYAFDSVASGIDSSDGVFEVGKNDGIKPNYSYRAIFGLATPIVTEVKDKTFATELNKTLDLNVALASDITIGNPGDDFNYTYTWYKAGDPSDTLVAKGIINKNTDSDGTYKLVVVATKSGFNNSDSSDPAQFTIAFIKTSINISIKDGQSTTRVYKNDDFIDEIVFDVVYNNTQDETLNSSEEMTLQELYSLMSTQLSGSKTIVTSITNGVAVNEIKNAGAYQIDFTLSSDTQNVYTFNESSPITFTVEKASINLPYADGGTPTITKTFGANDPTLTMLVQGIGEEVLVSFTSREQGETSGSYNLIGASTTNNNYEIVLAESNYLFVISPSEGSTLQAQISGTVTHTYDASSPTTVSVESGAEGQINLVVKSGDKVWGTFTLSNFKEISSSAEGKEPVVAEIKNVSVDLFADMTFSVKNAGKNVGNYQIIVSGNNTSYPGGFAFSNAEKAQITISQKAINISNVTKEFDQTNTLSINATSLGQTEGNKVEGLVDGEDLNITFTFDNNDIGVNKSVTVLLNDGTTGLANNYFVQNEQDLKGSITKSSKEISVSLDSTTFTYGQLTETDISLIIADAKIDGISIMNVLVNGEYKALAQLVLSIADDDAQYSTGNYLKVGGRTLNVNVTSEYYSVSPDLISFELTINKLDITATASGEITKEYDGNDAVKQSFTFDSLDGDVLTYQAKYEDKNVGIDKPITIDLQGVDAENYNLTNASTLTGQITSVTIKVIADLDTIEFVDGAKPTGVTEFTFVYPFTDAESEFNKITAPQKMGYNFVGWENNEKTFNKDNIINVFETAIASRQGEEEIIINISAQWEINVYSVTITTNATVGLLTFSDGFVGTQESGDTKTYKYNYYSDVTVEAQPSNSYKGTYSKHIAKISDNFEDTINFDPANITFVVSAPDGLYPAGANVSFDNLSDIWAEGLVPNSMTTSRLSNTISALNQSFLPTASLTGYAFKGWTYSKESGEQVIVSTDGETTISSIVNAIMPTYNSDIIINLSLNFEANKHSLEFNLNYDGSSDTVEALSVVYGQEIGELPTPTRTGYSLASWWLDINENGVIDEDTDIQLSSTFVWKWDRDYTALAKWEFGIYNFTIVTSANSGEDENVLTKANPVIIVRDSENHIVSLTDGKYRLSNNQNYTISVSLTSGYSIAEWKPGTGYSISGDETNLRTVSSVVQDSNLDILVKANVNTIVLTGTNNINVDVKITPDDASGEEATPESSTNFTAKTGQTVKIIVKANAGYTISETTLPKISSGTAKISGPEKSEDTYTYTLSAFTTNINLDFTNVVQANSNTITIEYDDEQFTDFTVMVNDSIPTSVGAGKYVAKTGDVIKVSLTEAHGYKYYTYSLNPQGVTVDVAGAEQSGVERELSFTISKFTSDFTITISAEAIKYKIDAEWIAVNIDNIVEADIEGISITEATQEIIQNALPYKSVITVESANTNQNYAFVGWFDKNDFKDVSVGQELELTDEFIEQHRLSDQVNYNLTVYDAVTLVAVYKYTTYAVSVSVRGEGTFTVNGSQDSLTAYNENLFYNSQLTLTATANAGYKLNGWYVVVDGEEQLYNGGANPYDEKIQGALTLIAVFEARELTVEIVPTVLNNGVYFDGENIKNVSYGKIEVGSWDGNEFTAKSEHTNSDSIKVTTKTGEKIYIRISQTKEQEAGYKFVSLSPGDSQVVINSLGSGIYELGGFNAGSETQAKSYTIKSIFEAKTTAISISFSDGERQLEAGRITITNEYGLNIVQNNSSVVTIYATTGAKINGSASINLGQLFASENTIKSTSGSIDILSGEVTNPDSSTGWSQTISFTLSNFSGPSVNITILVIPQTYKVQLKNWNGTPIGEPFEVTYGAPFELPEGLVKPTREGYTLLGFYKYANAVGNKYIDADFNPVGNWTDNGYQRNASGVYVISDNFDVGTNTFELYASYSINSTRLQFGVIPISFKGLSELEATEIVQKLYASNSWSSPTDKSFVEVIEGASIDLVAPEFENYQFAYWEIERFNQDGISQIDKIYESKITDFEHDNNKLINITLHYNVKISVTSLTENTTSTIGGDAYFSYIESGSDKEITVRDYAFIPTNASLNLSATAKPGYKFVGWYQNGQFIASSNNITVLATNEKPLTPSSYEAKFESEEFTLRFGDYDKEHIIINKVTIGTGDPVDFKNGITVKSNQWVRIYLDVAYRIVIYWEGGNVVASGANSYTYIVKYEDVKDGIITLTPKISYEQCDVNMSVVLDGGDSTEAALAGEVSYIDIDGEAQTISTTEGESLVDVVIGSVIEFRYKISQNYKLAQIVVNGEPVSVELTGNSFFISILPAEDGLAVDIEIHFARDLWVDSVEEGYALSGEGTDGVPYKVTSSKDLAFIAYKINVEGNTDYANAVYVVENNIDMTGKYWSPIGTESNMFNGKFYYRDHTISGISVEYGYEGELSSDRVFGYVTDNALFEVPQDDFTIAIIIVCVVVALIIIALVIFFILRKRRKRKLEQLANS